MKTPPFPLELGSLRCGCFQGELTSRTSPRVGQHAVEKKPHLDLVADRMQLGVDCLMKFSQPPDSLFCHANALIPDPRSLVLPVGQASDLMDFAPKQLSQSVVHINF
jgi:hypothetical protein